MKYKGDRRKIKSVFIHRPLQREFTMLMVIILMVATLLIGVVIHYTIHETLTDQTGGLGRTAAYEFLAEIDQKILIRVFAVLFITIVAARMGGVFFLHRVAGPIYRIRITLRQLADGKIPKNDVKLRRGDFFAELAVETNRLMNRLREQHPDWVVSEKPSETPKK